MNLTKIKSNLLYNMERVNLLEHIYKRFYFIDYPTNERELNYEKSLAIILYAKILVETKYRIADLLGNITKYNYITNNDIEQMLNYDITRDDITRILGIFDGEPIDVMISQHMQARSAFCRAHKKPNKSSKASDIMRELRKTDIQKWLTEQLPEKASDIMEKLRKKNIEQCLSFVFAIKGNDFFVDPYILNIICEYLKDFTFFHILKDDDDDSENASGGGKSKHKKHKSKRRKSKRKSNRKSNRKSKRKSRRNRRKTRRKKR